MATFQCKMCGGTVECQNGMNIGVCDCCGTQQTLPVSKDTVSSDLFERANDLRKKCDFDRAEEYYLKIAQSNPNDPEAHWGIVLCHYGVEYVDDPLTGKKIPTCHRTNYEAIADDLDYKNALQNADMLQRTIYEDEAKKIDVIQKGILNIAKKETPFDVFICYKETDEFGKRTVDSTLANDIYYQLTQEGFKVFYAAITLEDKLGEEYEPYIFSALNSAKVMLVIGTKPEYFNAVWVKNEWSRYLKIIKTDRSKLLIPCYRDMDAYSLPDEFAHLQAQDMSKIGFVNDVVRGIKKVIGQQANAQQSNNAFNTPVQSEQNSDKSGYVNASSAYDDTKKQLKNLFSSAKNTAGVVINDVSKNLTEKAQTVEKRFGEKAQTVENQLNNVDNTPPHAVSDDQMALHKSGNVVSVEGKAAKNKWLALLLCFVGGVFGLHKFYEGKIGMGILYIFTGGFFTIGVIVDALKILGKPNPYYVRK